VRFDVSDTFDDGYSFIERVGPGSDLYYSGTALGDVRDATIVAVFSGTLVLRSGVAVLAECEATDHLFELVRSNGREERSVRAWRRLPARTGGWPGGGQGSPIR
jgi:hypothetical protein